MPRRCRGISLPPSRRSRDTSASLRYAQPSVSTGPPRRGRQEFRACGRGGAMHPKGTCSASLHCVGIAPYGRSIEGAFGKTEGCGHPALRTAYRKSMRHTSGRMWASAPTEGLSKCGGKTAGGAEPLPYALPIEGLCAFYSMTGRFSTTWAQRGHRSGCLALLPTAGSTFQQRPHLQPLAGRTATDCSVPTSTRT